MSFSWNRWTRKLHRWGAVVTFLPLFLVISTGLLLQIKKQVTWVQPATAKGTEGFGFQIDLNEILQVAVAAPEAGVTDWSDIDRLDVRPRKGIVKIRCNNRQELQVDLTSGKLLASNYRRSDFIESLHDGSFFSDAAKLWIFLPNGLILFGLLFTGAYLWWLPISVKRSKRKKRKPNQKKIEQE